MAKLKEIAKKDSEQEILLQGLENLITKITNQNTDNMTTLVNSLKKNDSSGTESSGVTFSRTKKFLKPAKVPSLTKDMGLDTYSLQIVT